MHKSFTDKIYELTNRIPRGKVATYGQLAEMAGSPGAARAVGTCMGHNPNAPHTPCHRVVASDGKLTGYSAEGGISKKKKMLIDEGVEFIGNRVNLHISRWQP